jgi:GT2 family glycosyltransferase
MNLGSNAASGEFLCHINNDLYVAPNWNGFLIEAMERHRLDAASPLGLEMMPTASLTDWMQGRWAAIGQGRLSSGKGIEQLRTMIQAMYGDWERYCGEAHRAFAGTMFDGIVGSCVMIRRSTYDVLGGLDERIQSADWDLYYTLRQREQLMGDVKRCMVVGASFVHHFIRATIKSKREPFACTHPRLSIPEKWSIEQQEALWCKPNYFRSASDERAFQQILRRRVGKPLRKLAQEFNRAFSWRWRYVSPEKIVALHRRQFQQAATMLPSGVSS